MKQFICLFISIVCFIALINDARADKIDDFEKLFEEVTANFDTALRYKDSRYTREYEKKLSKLALEARKIQALVVKLKIKKMNFPKQVSAIKDIYFNRKRGSKVRRSKRVGRSGGRIHAQNQIKQYLKKLKKMEFSVEKQSYKKDIKEEEGLDEFDRLLRAYSRGIRPALLANKNAHWVDVFEDKLARMVFLGREIQNKLNKKRIKMKFSKEVIFLSDAYKKSGFTGSGRRALGNGKSSRFSKRADLQAKYESLMMDVGVSIKKLREHMVTLKEKNFVLYPEIKKRNKKKNAVDLDEEFKPDKDDEEEDNVDYDVMTKEELIAHLRDARKKIYKSNKKLGGISRDVSKSYLSTLTKNQKKRYKLIQKKYKERGYSSTEAASYALIEIHSIFLHRNEGATKKELITILKKIEKD